MPVSDKDFNNIKIHTQYSICEGAIKIDELAEYCKLNKTIIFATHNRDLANKADYKLSILNGNIKRANV